MGRIDNRKLRILVTGSTGFVGTHLMQHLKNLKDRYDVIGVARSGGDHSIDLSSPSAVSHLLKLGPFDVIVHLAARIGVDESFERPADFYRDNIEGTLAVLDVARQIGNCSVVYLSSYVYGSPEYVPVDEEHPIVLPNPYAMSKYIGEQLCQKYQEHFDVPVCILRPFNIYGPGQSPSMLVPTIIGQLLAGGDLILKSSKPQRDYVYIDDVVDAIARVIEHRRSAGVVNIGSGSCYSVEDIVTVLLKIHGKKVTVHYQEEKRRGGVDKTLADVSKAKKLIGWEPRVSLEEGLELTYNAYSHELEA